ncbi:aminotransferase-like domain-containing protein [Sphingorhabdus sp. 109]|jgi:DNA-binding transcriptional MocR family regulator|uniref:aminotransferase-like domain-containing protein n=1 Tax=Sphingorhabdus sp. 109 TaxID=2653173 RepID=UPI0012F2CAB4
MHWENILATRASRLKASEIRELLKLIGQPGVISFAGGIPDGALFPVAEFQRAFAAMCEGENASAALQYATSEGHLPLRQWIVGEMAKLGIPCDSGNIIITSGSQQALDYLGKLLLSPGDTALVQWPTYLGALSAFNAYEPVYDRLETGALRPAESYRQAASGGRVKFAYLSSEFCNPTGESIDREARIQLLNLARDLDIAIIEDAAYQSLRYDGEVIPPILALDIEREGSIEATRTLYCGSFSKTLSPGLRVGWVCGAKSVISRLVLMKQASDLHSGVVNQMAVADVATRASTSKSKRSGPSIASGAIACCKPCPGKCRPVSTGPSQKVACSSG